MPHIIAENCFTLVKGEEIEKVLPKPSLWKRFKKFVAAVFGNEPEMNKNVQKLFLLVCESLELNAADQARFWENYKRHLGKNSHYRSKKALEDSLRWIYEKIREGEGAKIRFIAEKILEGSVNCTEGFHNRANELVISLGKFHSIDAYLQQYRSDIVEKIARKNTDEVHAFNRFFMYAENAFFVPVPNKDDIYVGAIEEDEIKIALEQGFLEHYQFWGIINAINQKMRIGLSESAEYEGKKVSGYEKGAYDKMIAFLSCPDLLGNSNDPFNEWLIVDEEYKVIDLNWPNIMYRVWKILSQKYFQVPAYEHFCYEMLFNPENPADLLNNFRPDGGICSTSLFINLTEFIDFLNHTNWLEEDKKIIFSHLYLEREEYSIGLRDFLVIAPLLLKPKSLQDFPELFQIPLWKSLIETHFRIALTFAQISNKQAIRSILAYIQLLPSRMQLGLYSYQRPHEIAKNSVFSSCLLEAEVGLLLMELKEKAESYTGSNPNLAAKTKELHKTLSDQHSNYLKSERKLSDWETMKTGYTESINKAKETILKEYPDVVSILSQLLIALTGVGAIYLTYKACQNYSNNRSLFFPSPVEIKVNEIEDYVFTSMKPIGLMN